MRGRSHMTVRPCTPTLCVDNAGTEHVGARRVPRPGSGGGGGFEIGWHEGGDTLGLMPLIRSKPYPVRKT